jgi:hypothetical protein
MVSFEAIVENLHMTIGATKENKKKMLRIEAWPIIKTYKLLISLNGSK